MNDRFNKDFADIFGGAKIDPFPMGGTPSRKQMYPGSVGAQTPVPGMHGGMVRGQEPLIVKSGHTSITRSAMRHKGQP